MRGNPTEGPGEGRAHWGDSRAAKRAAHSGRGSRTSWSEQLGVLGQSTVAPAFLEDLCGCRGNLTNGPQLGCIIRVSWETGSSLSEPNAGGSPRHKSQHKCLRRPSKQLTRAPQTCSAESSPSYQHRRNIIPSTRTLIPLQGSYSTEITRNSGNHCIEMFITFMTENLGRNQFQS